MAVKAEERRGGGGTGDEAFSAGRTSLSRIARPAYSRFWRRARRTHGMEQRVLKARTEAHMAVNLRCHAWSATLALGSVGKVGGAAE